MARKKSKEIWKVYGNVFDEFTNRHIFKLGSQGYFNELVSAYRMGKEANIFIADTKDGKDVIIKIYRLENCNFNKMFSYLAQDERYENLKGQRRKIIFSWVQREYRNLMIAREVIRVPTPITFKDNILITEMIGHDEPSQELKDQKPEDLEAFLEEVLNMVKKLKVHGLVHGDLSGFNILNFDEQPVFIDFSQATTTNSPGWEELLKRDLTNVLAVFKKWGVERDLEETYEEIIRDDE